MSEIRDLAWARAKLAKLLRFNYQEADEAFAGTAANPWQQIDDFLGEAYNAIVVDARSNVSPDIFVVLRTLTWASGELTLTLPSIVDLTSMFSIEDITNGDPGDPISVARNELPSYHSTVRMLDYHTLQWGTEGPDETKTLRVKALGRAEPLTSEQEEPVFIPYDHRYLWVWEAALLAREFADDDNVPRLWMERRDRYRDLLHQEIGGFLAGAADRPSIQLSDGYYLTF